MAQDFYHVHMTQRIASDPHWAVNCSAYVAAMAINDATLGGVDVNGRLVRAYSSEPKPDPSSPGLNLGQVEDVAWDKFRVRLTDMQKHTWAEVKHALVEGRRVLLQIEYKELGAYRCQAGGDFGHMVLLSRPAEADGFIRASDPLCKTSKRYSGDVLQDAAQAFARRTGVSEGLRWAMTRPIPLLVK